MFGFIRMAKTSTIIVLLSLQAACVFFSSPDDNQSFANVESLHAFEGTYVNRGEVGKLLGSDRPFLSAILWPSAGLHHESITTVEVKAMDDRILRVIARSTEESVTESTFLAGRDFQLTGGKILINRQAGIAGFKSGEPMLGPYYGQIQLGLDRQGHGKSRETIAAAGMVFLIVPVFLAGGEDIRFERLSVTRQ